MLASADLPSNANSPTLLDPERLRAADSLQRREPFPFLIAGHQLPDSARGSLRDDFPRYASAGYFPYADADCGPLMRQLVAELTSPAFADAIGEALGIQGLSAHPTLVTICRSLNRRHGTIHTDSKSKVASVLLYLNESWSNGDAGCLRFLGRIDDIDDLLVPEIQPVYGNLVAFKRAENSYHGHLPFEGERRVIQVAWLTSEAEKARKTRRGRASRLLKWLLGKFDRRHGSGRDRNAFHR